MTSEDNQQAFSMNFANRLINLANNSLEEGIAADEIAEGLRHAAANFSAFALFRTDEKTVDPNKNIENFLTMYEYYLGVHKPKESPDGGLSATIAQAKDEL